MTLISLDLVTYFSLFKLLVKKIIINFPKLFWIPPKHSDVQAIYFCSKQGSIATLGLLK